MTVSVRLDSVAEVRLGRQRSPKDHVGPTMRPYMRAANIGWDGWKLDDVKSMNFTSEEMAVYRLQPGDLLLGEASGSASEVGKPALWNGEIEECAFQNTLIRVRPSGADPRYLLHYFKFLASTGEFAARSRGAGINHLGSEALASWMIPLPSAEDQRRMATLLDAADALRVKRRKALDLLANLRDAVVELELSKHPTRTKLGEHLSFVTSGSRGWARYYAESGQRFIRTQDVLLGAIDEADPAYVRPPDSAEARRTVVHYGDFLVTITGVVGRVAAVPRALEGSYVSQHVAIARPLGSLRPEFAEAFMCSASGQRQLDRLQYGQTKPGLNLSQIRDFELPVPSLCDQDRLIEKLGAIRMRVTAADGALRSLNALFASLQHSAFRGEL